MFIAPELQLTVVAKTLTRNNVCDGCGGLFFCCRTLAGHKPYPLLPALQVVDLLANGLFGR